jgi:ABC-type Fe3+/spermidine/putrescine transport system ATPase subunit
VSLADRTVRCGPLLLNVPDPSFNHAAGEKVDLFLRPEDISLQVLSNGTAPEPSQLKGRVTSLTFLGPVTRVGLDTDLGPLLADVSSAVALSLAADTVVAVNLDSASLRSIAPTL